MPMNGMEAQRAMAQGRNPMPQMGYMGHNGQENRDRMTDRRGQPLWFGGPEAKSASSSSPGVCGTHWDVSAKPFAPAAQRAAEAQANPSSPASLHHWADPAAKPFVPAHMADGPQKPQSRDLQQSSQDVSKKPQRITNQVLPGHGAISGVGEKRSCQKVSPVFSALNLECAGMPRHLQNVEVSKMALPPSVHRPVHRLLQHWVQLHHCLQLSKKPRPRQPWQLPKPEKVGAKLHPTNGQQLHEVQRRFTRRGHRTSHNDPQVAKDGRDNQ